MSEQASGLTPLSTEQEELLPGTSASKNSAVDAESIMNCTIKLSEVTLEKVTRVGASKEDEKGTWLESFSSLNAPATVALRERERLPSIGPHY